MSKGTLHFSLFTLHFSFFLPAFDSAQADNHLWMPLMFSPAPLRPSTLALRPSFSPHPPSAPSPQGEGLSNYAFVHSLNILIVLPSPPPISRHFSLFSFHFSFLKLFTLHSSLFIFGSLSSCRRALFTSHLSPLTSHLSPLRPSTLAPRPSF